MDLGQDHGQLLDLSSPILTKIQHAFMMMRASLAGETQDVFTSFRSIDGVNKSTMYVGWSQADAKLVLTCKIMDFTFLDKMRHGKMAGPAWLRPLAPQARVESTCLDVMNSFVTPEHGSPGLKELIEDMIGDVPPRRIISVGFCGAGAVSTLAASWLAVMWPTADVRCVSFGAPALGSVEFASAFKWLVGISYRVMFRRDPVPTVAPSILKHVHGAVYLSGSNTMQPGVQPKSAVAKGDMGDHTLPGYSGALYGTCKLQLDRQQSMSGTCRAQFGSKLFDLTHEQAKDKASLQLAQTIDSPKSLNHARSIGPADSVTAVDTREVPHEEGEEVRPQATGLGSYVRSAAGNLAWDALSVSRSFARATLGGVRRLYSNPSKPPTPVAGVGSQQGTAFSSGDAALTDADGFVAEADRFLIMGKEADTDNHGLGDGGKPLHEAINGGKPPQPSQLGDTTDLAARGIQDDVCAAESPGGTRADSAGQVTWLGEAAIAVNEAEDQLLEMAEELEAGKSRKGLQGILQDCSGAGQSAVSAVKAARKACLNKTFSMLDRDSFGAEQGDLSNLQKVLVVGKISQAAVLAASAYRNNDTFKTQTGLIKSRLIYDKQHHDTKVHVSWLEGGTAIFAFRGTASTQDGLQDVKIVSRNIDYLQELYPGVKAHMGFVQQFAAVCQPDRADTNIAAVLKELSGGKSPNRVICCGHSLGGALATLGAAWSALEYPDADIRCITFGSPRVANKVFSRAFNALVGTSLRLVHGFDPVPALPPSLMYKHVPGVIHIRRDDLLLRSRPWHTMLRSNVSDHGMRRYCLGIYKHMPGGLDAHSNYFFVKPMTKLRKTLEQVQHKREEGVQEGQQGMVQK